MVIVHHVGQVVCWITVRLQKHLVVHEFIIESNRPMNQVVKAGFPCGYSQLHSTQLPCCKSVLHFARAQARADAILRMRALARQDRKALGVDIGWFRRAEAPIGVPILEVLSNARLIGMVSQLPQGEDSHGASRDSIAATAHTDQMGRLCEALRHDLCPSVGGSDPISLLRLEHCVSTITSGLANLAPSPGKQECTWSVSSILNMNVPPTFLASK